MRAQVFELGDNEIGDQPLGDEHLQLEMANEHFIYLVVAKNGLELWQVRDGEDCFTGLLFDSVPDAHSYVFGSWKIHLPSALPIQ